jgi:hypothetical protein
MLSLCHSCHSCHRASCLKPSAASVWQRLNYQYTDNGTCLRSSPRIILSHLIFSTWKPWTTNWMETESSNNRARSAWHSTMGSDWSPLHKVWEGDTTIEGARGKLVDMAKGLNCGRKMMAWLGVSRVLAMLPLWDSDQLWMGIIKGKGFTLLYLYLFTFLWFVYTCLHFYGLFISCLHFYDHSSHHTSHVKCINS